MFLQYKFLFATLIYCMINESGVSPKAKAHRHTHKDKSKLFGLALLNSLNKCHLCSLSKTLPDA